MLTKVKAVIIVTAAGVSGLVAQFLIFRVLAVTASHPNIIYLSSNASFIFFSCLGIYFSRLRPKSLPTLSFVFGFFLFLSGAYLVIFGYNFISTLPVSVIVSSFPGFCCGAIIPLLADWFGVKIIRIFIPYNFFGAIAIIMVDIFLIGIMPLSYIICILGAAFLAISLFLRGKHEDVVSASTSASRDTRSMLSAFFISSGSFLWLFYIVRVTTFALTTTFPAQYSAFLSFSFIWISLSSFVAIRFKRIGIIHAGSAMLLHISLISLFSTDLFSFYQRILETPFVSHFYQNGFLYFLFATLWMSSPLFWSGLIFARLLDDNEPIYKEIMIFSGAGSALGLLCAGLLARVDYLAMSPVFEIIFYSAGTMLVVRKKYLLISMVIIVLSIVSLSGDRIRSEWFELSKKRGIVNTQLKCRMVYYADEMSTYEALAGASTQDSQNRPAFDKLLYTSGSSWSAIVGGYYVIDSYYSHYIFSDSERRVGVSPGLYFPVGKPRVMVIGVGSGQTVSGASSIASDVEAIDIDPVAIENLDDLREFNDEVKKKSNVNFVVDEGLNFLRGRHEKFDVIINTSTYSFTPSAAKLYSIEMLDAVSRSLTEDGIYITYVDCIQAPGESLWGYLAMLKTRFKHLDIINNDDYYLVVCRNRDLPPDKDYVIDANGMKTVFSRISKDIIIDSAPIISTIDKPILTGLGQKWLLGIDGNVMCR